MNPAIPVLAGLAAAALLLLSGSAQLADRSSSHRAFEQVNLPLALTSISFVTGWAVVEILAAVGLLFAPQPVARIAGWLVAAMFLGFLVLIVRVARAPEPVACPCFGRLDTEPVGPHTVLRSAAWFALSLIALIGSANGSTFEQASRLTSAEMGLLQLGLLLAGALLIVHAMGRLRPAAESTRVQRPDPDTHSAVSTSRQVANLPEAYLLDLFGGRHDVRRLAGTERTVLVFLSPGCGSCARLAEQLPSARETLSRHGVALRAVTESPPNKAISQFPLLGSFLHQDLDNAIADALEVTTLPAAVVLREGAPGPVAYGPHAIDALMSNLTADATIHPGG